MARSRWKLTYFSGSIWRKIVIIKKKKTLLRKITYDRASSIPKCFFLRLLRIHKGKRLRRIVVNPYSIGKKIGEFSFTRKPYHYPAKRYKKKKNFVRR